jgi:hypothetical protein
MLNTSFPFMQSSSDQFMEVFQKLIEVYTNTVLAIGIMLLILLVWLCASELQQSKRSRRAKRQPQARQSQPAVGRKRVRGLLEESSW